MGQSEAKSELEPRAREFRNGTTEPEQRLWRYLRNSQLGGFKFRRQVAIPPFVGGFLCPLKALIVEVDGGTHDAEQDRRRDLLLKRSGYTTLRFSNTDVIGNVEGVLLNILDTLRSLPDRWPYPNPSPEGERLKEKATSPPSHEGQRE